MPDMYEKLSGKTAIVTGGAMRIGRTISLALADSGVNVVVHYNHSRESAEEVASQAKRKGVGAWTVKCDLSRPENVTEMMDRVGELTSGLDFLINNASVFPESRLGEIDCKDFHETLDINAVSPLVLSENFVNMTEKGAIVNILDNRIDRVDTNHVAYQLSKNMFATLTKMMAVQYAPKIRVNAVAPGMILPPVDRDEAYIAQQTSKSLLRKSGAPSDIADAVIYLLSAEFVTGEIIYVDGGENIKSASL